MKIKAYFNPYPKQSQSKFGVFAVSTKRSSLFEWIALFFGHENCGDCRKYQGMLWVFGSTFITAGLFGVAGLLVMAAFWLATFSIFRWLIAEKWTQVNAHKHKISIDALQLTETGKTALQSQLNAILVDGPNITIEYKEPGGLKGMAEGFSES